MRAQNFWAECFPHLNRVFDDSILVIIQSICNIRQTHIIDLIARTEPM